MPTLHKFKDLLILVFGLCVSNEINFVLKDDDVFQLHYLNSCQMLGCLRLGARFIASCECVLCVCVCVCVCERERERERE